MRVGECLANHILDCRGRPGLKQCLAVIIPEANTIGVAAAIRNYMEVSGIVNWCMPPEDGKKGAAEADTRLGSRLMRENKLLMLEMTLIAHREHRIVFHNDFVSGLINDKHKSHNMQRMLDARNYVMLEMKGFMAIRPQVPASYAQYGKKAGVYYTGKESGVKTDDFVMMMALNWFMQQNFYGNVIKYGQHW